LSIGEGTVKNHLKSIYSRLPLGAAGNRRVAAALWYLRISFAAPDTRRHAARRGGGSPPLCRPQWRVLERLARGESDKQIARALGIAPQTVKNHLTSTYRRLPLGDVDNQRVAAALWYVREGQAQQEDANRG